MQRRTLLRTLGATALAPSATRLWAAADERAPKLLVVFLRGGYDAANLLVPHGSPFYYEARPTIAIPRPGSGADAAIGIDAQWAMAPALRDNVAPLFARGECAFVPFAGTDDVSRSHFETQDRIEMGVAADSRPDYASGFMNRLAGVLGLNAQGAMAFTDRLPLAFRGAVGVGNQALRGTPSEINARQAALVERMYAGSELAGAVKSGFEVREQVAREMKAEMGDPAMSAEMNAASRNAIAARGFEAEARRIGRLMRDTVQLGFVDIGGWDTHVAEGAATGLLATRLGELGRGLVALREACGPAWQRTVVVVMSEFGRTFRENGNRGTDHGHGSVYWVLGGAVRGARVLGEQQEVSAATLFQQRDYPVLNEYRAVLGGLVARMWGLGEAPIAKVFAGARPKDIGLV